MKANDVWADAIKEALAHKTMLRASELTVGIFVKHPDYPCIFMVLETHLNPGALIPNGQVKLINGYCTELEHPFLIEGFQDDAIWTLCERSEFAEQHL